MEQIGQWNDPRRMDLARRYHDTIGYDPFLDDPTITEDEVEQTLAEHAAEAA